jgi:hypothetical protein
MLPQSHGYLALYHPYMRFPSDNWVKLAALYWDKLGRIVPDNLVPEDSEVVRRLTNELGFVENYAPSPLREVDSVAREFLHVIGRHAPEL